MDAMLVLGVSRIRRPPKPYATPRALSPRHGPVKLARPTDLSGPSAAPAPSRHWLSQHATLYMISGAYVNPFIKIDRQVGISVRYCDLVAEARSTHSTADDQRSTIQEFLTVGRP